MLLQTESYAVLSKHVLPPECIIRIEDMDGKEVYNRRQERDQRMAYLARHRILQEEGAEIARRAAEAGGLPWETVGGPSASSTEPSVPEPEPTPRVAPIEPPAIPKQMPPKVKAIVEKGRRGKS